MAGVAVIDEAYGRGVDCGPRVFDVDALAGGASKLTEQQRLGELAHPCRGGEVKDGRETEEHGGLHTGSSG